MSRACCVALPLGCQDMLGLRGTVCLLLLVLWYLCVGMELERAGKSELGLSSSVSPSLRGELCRRQEALS